MKDKSWRKRIFVPPELWQFYIAGDSNRWDIEVIFKIVKQHLKLAKEIQTQDYDALIAHTSIVFMRYWKTSVFSKHFTDCSCWQYHASKRGELFVRKQSNLSLILSSKQHLNVWICQRTKLVKLKSKPEVEYVIMSAPLPPITSRLD